MSQLDVAAKIGISQPSFSHVERGSRRLTAPEARKIAKLLALGQRVQGGEIDPSFALVTRGRLGTIEPIRTPKGRLGIFNDARAAVTARRIVELAGLEVYIAPVWLQWAFEVVGKGEAPVYVDGDKDPIERARSVAGHALEMTEAIAAEQEVSEEAGRRAAALLRKVG